jgi:hypothetical protein
VAVAKDVEVGGEVWHLVFLAVAVEVEGGTRHHVVASLVRQGGAPEYSAAGGRLRGGVGGADEQHAGERRGEQPHARGRRHGGDVADGSVEVGRQERARRRGE